MFITAGQLCGVIVFTENFAASAAAERGRGWLWLSRSSRGAAGSTWQCLRATAGPVWALDKGAGEAAAPNNSFLVTLVFFFWINGVSSCSANVALDEPHSCEMARGRMRAGWQMLSQPALLSTGEEK